jgi:hypothetical protein
VPERYLHEKISELITGKKCSLTHKIIDYPVRYLGRKHRILFHDLFSVMIIGILSDGYEGFLSGILHLITDYYINSKFKKKIAIQGLKLLKYFKK